MDQNWKISLKLNIKAPRAHKMNRTIPIFFLNFFEDNGFNSLIPLGVNKSRIMWLIHPINIDKKM